MPARPTRPTRLAVERLEARETPAGGLWSTDTFDAAAPGSSPVGWSHWGSDGDSGFRAADGRAVSGRSLASAGSSVHTGRAWPNTIRPADVSATAAVFADSLIPAEVFVRGQNLESSKPTYYAGSVTRGLEVKLVRIDNGQTIPLATLQSATYLSGVWVDLTLTARGDHLQVRVQRRDTAAWLNRFGGWQPTPAAAIDARDRQILSSGRVGVAREASYAGTIFFDDVRVGPAVTDLTPPVTRVQIRDLQPPQQAGSVSGLVRLTATALDTSRIDLVEFYVDGTLVTRRATAPFQYDFETRNLANGSHTLTVRAWDSAGNMGEAKAAFEVLNQAAGSRPDLPRHYSHVRYAALAYNGTPLGPDDEKLLKDSIDLVAPHARYLDQIDQAAPATPQLIYSNISNLYLDLLTDWLAFADRRGLSRESAFYHVARPTTFIGDSPSSQPVTWFWNVQRGPADGGTGFTNLTTESRTGWTGDVRFGGAGEAVYLGYPDRFRELNLMMAQAGGVAWAGVLEYPTNVDLAGRPTTWKAIDLATDSTKGFLLSGQVTFDPPADWQPAVVSGSLARLYYVRVRTTAGDVVTAPVAARVLGRDYVNANEARTGTIPAFDTAADANRDGYLADPEYARRRAGFDARFVYESRFFYPYYGQMRFVTNPSGPGVGAWAVDYHRRLLSARPLADGVFMDNSGGKAPTNGAALVESTETYPTDYGAVLGAVNRGIAPKWVLANTSGGGANVDRVVRQVPATIEEFAIRPLSHSWMQFRDLADSVARRLALTNPPGYLILDTLSAGGSPTDARTRVAALAYYYLLADPESTFLMTWGGEEPASAWSRHWFDAIAFDVGRPKGTWTEFASGADPANSALTYRVFQRAYDNALVLYKPLSYASGQGTGGRDDSTATTHALDGAYRPLNADGTLGASTRSITLRNGEGAILVRA